MKTFCGSCLDTLLYKGPKINGILYGRKNVEEYFFLNIIILPKLENLTLEDIWNLDGIHEFVCNW